ncbi:MAG: PilZ domain-containing protein [Spirochaetia bacterium]
MNDKSKSNAARKEREKCYAKVIFKDTNTPGYVRDISTGGFRFELLKDVDWEIGSSKKVVIVPEEEIGFAPVHGSVEIRWKRSEGVFINIGAKLVSVQDKYSLENYKLLMKYFKTHVRPDVTGRNPDS